MYIELLYILVLQFRIILKRRYNTEEYRLLSSLDDSRLERILLKLHKEVVVTITAIRGGSLLTVTRLTRLIVVGLIRAVVVVRFVVFAFIGFFVYVLLSQYVSDNQLSVVDKGHHHTAGCFLTGQRVLRVDIVEYNITVQFEVKLHFTVSIVNGSNVVDAFIITTYNHFTQLTTLCFRHVLGFDVTMDSGRRGNLLTFQRDILHREQSIQDSQEGNQLTIFKIELNAGLTFLFIFIQTGVYRQVQDITSNVEIEGSSGTFFIFTPQGHYTSVGDVVTILRGKLLLCHVKTPNEIQNRKDSALLLFSR
nr:MAG TPA: hypothetical protein [Caudoviricetes sp.]